MEFAPLHCAEFRDAVALHVEEADVVRAAVDAFEMERAAVDSPADGIARCHGFDGGDALGSFCAGRLWPGDFCA